MKRRKPYYEALGVAKDASPAEVKRAYRDLAKRLHPDRLRDPEQARRAEERLKEINAAWSDYLALSRSSHAGHGNTRRGASHRAASRRSARAPADEVDEEIWEVAAGHGRSSRASRDRYRAERARASRDREEREVRAREAADRVRAERMRAHVERREFERAYYLRISRFVLAGFAGVCLALLVAVFLLLALSQ